MTRTRDSPGVQAYFDAVRRIYSLESQILTAVLPHPGERGRNDEERLRTFLRNTLPRRFGVGSGFVISAVEGSQPSRQMDVVIFDDLFNAPMHREAASYVFPVEIVLATVEVKGCIRPQDVSKCVDNIASVRSIGKERYHVVQVPQEKPEGSGNWTMERQRIVATTPPRAFVFAYDAEGWRDAQSFATSWASALAAETAHLHGVVVLTKDWFVYQVPFKKGLRTYQGDALLRFQSALLSGVEGLAVSAPYDRERYYRLDAVPLGTVEIGGTGEAAGEIGDPVDGGQL